VNAKLKRMYAERALQNAAIDVLPEHRLRAGTSEDDTERLLMQHRPHTSTWKRSSLAFNSHGAISSEAGPLISAAAASELPYVSTPHFRFER
jgi:hypothetical protein